MLYSPSDIWVGPPREIDESFMDFSLGGRELGLSGGSASIFKRGLERLRASDAQRQLELCTDDNYFCAV